MFVYADNAATTRVSPAAREAMLPWLSENYFNPSALYAPAQRVREAVEEARAAVAGCLGAQAREIVFTSGGSESDNQALVSCARLGARKGKKHLISTKFEHHAVLHTLKALEKQGFEVTLLDIPPDGVLRPEAVRDALREDSCLVSVMLANNEIGTLQPVREIGALCRERGVPFHCDAVQAVGHIPVNVEELNVDLLSLSGHKFHAPKGVGALYCRKGLYLYPLLEGGGQERGKRAGTENVAGILALAAALRECCETLPESQARVTALREALTAGLLQIPHTRLNGDPVRRVPGTVNVCFEAVEGERLLLMLDRAGICASSGSACNAGSLDPSHVLLSLGVPHELARGSLRLSLGEYNTREEVDYLLSVLPGIVESLRETSPVWEELQQGRRAHLC